MILEDIMDKRKITFQLIIIAKLFRVNCTGKF